MLDDTAFEVYLASARYGSHINLVSAVSSLSEEQLCSLLRELEKTVTGKLCVRKSDYEDDLRIFLTMKY